MARFFVCLDAFQYQVSQRCDSAVILATPLLSFVFVLFAPVADDSPSERICGEILLNGLETAQEVRGDVSGSSVIVV